MSRRWPRALRLMHWLTAGLVAIMIPAVLGAQALTETATDRAETLVGLHIACGLAVLALTLPRLILRLALRAPPPVPPGLEGLIVCARSLVFYALLLILPLTGIFKLTLSGLDIMVFGVTLLRSGATAPVLARYLNTAHAWLAWSFLALIALHGLAAIGHALRARKAASAKMQIPT